MKLDNHNSFCENKIVPEVGSASTKGFESSCVLEGIHGISEQLISEKAQPIKNDKVKQVGSCANIANKI